MNEIFPSLHFLPPPPSSSHYQTTVGCECDWNLHVCLLVEPVSDKPDFPDRSDQGVGGHLYLANQWYYGRDDKSGAWWTLQCYCHTLGLWKEGGSSSYIGQDR